MNYDGKHRGLILSPLVALIGASRLLGTTIGVVTAGVFAFAGTATATDWPTRPLTMVIPFAAGGTPDVLGRVLAPRLSELLGQQVVVENVGGAGGMTGANRVARAAPDGDQFVLGTSGTHAVNQTLYKKPLYNAAIDFAPVALVADLPLVLVARKDLPASNLQEFITYAKTNQAKMQYGSPGTGSSPHLACALLNAAIGINVTHIPYRGGGLAMQDLIAGRNDYQCQGTAIAIPQIESKTVKPIAILTRDRSAVLPTLASAHEQGLANFDGGAWSAIFLPKGASAAIVQKLHAAVVETMNTSSVQLGLKNIDANVVTSERRSPEYLREFVVSEIKKWEALIKASGIYVE